MDSDSAMVYFPTRDQFIATYFRQFFSLPDSTIYYVIKNPQSSKIYQKLVESCKYFFIKNPILKFHCLQIDENGGWKICSDKTCCSECTTPSLTKKIRVNIKTLFGCKIWIQHRLCVLSPNSNYASDMISNIYQCDAKCLKIKTQYVSLQQFLFFSQHAKNVNLEKVVITSNAYHEMSIEEIFAVLPNIQKFNFEFDPTSPTKVSKNTLKKLMQNPHFKNINHFTLDNVTEDFDIDALYNYYKNQNSNLLFSFWYDESPSEDYAKKLEEYVDEILALKLSDRRRPFIHYPELDVTKEWALFDLFKKKCCAK